MKKLICILLSTALLLLLFGCSGEKDKPSVTTPAPSESTEGKDEGTKELGIIGNILEIYRDDASDSWSFLLKVNEMIVEEWGETVLIVADGIHFEEGLYYVNASIEIIFTEYKSSEGTDYGCVIKAEKIINMSSDVYKPIIYLYPDSPTVCSVKLNLNGRFTCTYPEYDNGWSSFTAHPDGTLVFPDGKEYYALYWEGMQNADWYLSEGFCVRGEDTAEFLEWALSEQGLNRREANEFIVYWLPLMQDNPYNVISFQTKAYADTAVLEVFPEPDSVIRVFMTFYASEIEVSIPEQSFTMPSRDGFTVVEWGGSEIVK